MSKTTKQLSIFLENKAGTLYELLDFLDENKINIHAMNISEIEKYGVVRMIVVNPDNARCLLKENGYVTSLTDIFIVKISHRYGSLKNLISMLSNSGINIEFMYSMVYSGPDDSAYMAIAVDDVKKAQLCLDNSNVQLITNS